MTFRSYLTIAIFLICITASAQNVANYNIDATLNPKDKSIKGKQILTWINTSNHPVSELRFHTYLNAFKDVHSTFMKGSGGSLRSDQLDTTQKQNFGSIKISRIILNQTLELTGEQKFIQPDDLNYRDQTVMSLVLPRAIKPNETISLHMDFESRLPKIFARTGWADNDYFFVGQWFPKIGVLEKNGQWNCHQFHANTEFYSDFGTYQINITLPQRFKVAATGSKIREINLKNNLKTITYKIDNVHDFAWAAYPHFEEYSETYKGINLTAFMQPEHKNMAGRYFESVKNAIEFMDKHVGKYPFKTLTMVDPSFDGSGSGGMEYPTLITCGAQWGAGKWMRYQEVVTIHEFVHQYFQGMLASNEFENSWMDEGFTQYFEGRIMNMYYPKGSVFDFFGFTLNDAATSRDNYVSMHNPRITPIRTNVWQYPKGTYPIMSYTKPATVLITLQNLVGEEVMDEIIKTYFERFKFKHPQPEDFFETANEIVAKRTKHNDLNWFFQQTIMEARVCDYAVSDLVNQNQKGSFRLINREDMFLPVDVRITFSDGKTQMISWNGEDENFNYDKEIRSVYIDPERKNWMDINLINNSVSVSPPRLFTLKYVAKVIFWMQNGLPLV